MKLKQMLKELNALRRDGKENCPVILRTSGEDINYDKIFDFLEIHFEDDSVIIDFDIASFEDKKGVVK